MYLATLAWRQPMLRANPVEALATLDGAGVGVLSDHLLRTSPCCRLGAEEVERAPHVLASAQDDGL